MIHLTLAACGNTDGIWNGEPNGNSGSALSVISLSFIWEVISFILETFILLVFLPVPPFPFYNHPFISPRLAPMLSLLSRSNIPGKKIDQRSWIHLLVKIIKISSYSIVVDVADPAASDSIRCILVWERGTREWSCIHLAPRTRSARRTLWPFDPFQPSLRFGGSLLVLTFHSTLPGHLCGTFLFRRSGSDWMRHRESDAFLDSISQLNGPCLSMLAASRAVSRWCGCLATVQ